MQARDTLYNDTAVTGNVNLNTFLFCVYNESSTFYILMLYILIHTVVAVEFVVVLWNRVYNLCTLYVLKGGDRG